MSTFALTPSAGVHPCELQAHEAVVGNGNIRLELKLRCPCGSRKRYGVCQHVPQASLERSTVVLRVRCHNNLVVNAFKARLDKFWKHQSVKFDFTADLTGTGNRSEEVIK